MGANFNYLKYVLRHKWYVYKAGRRLGVNWWQLLVHDYTKFFPYEWTAYVDFFWRRDGKTNGSYVAGFDRAFDNAWLHHIHHNPHHWQYWVLREDDGDTKCLEMPMRYVLEMIADWCGAGMAQGNPLNTKQWYALGKYKIKLHPSTRYVVETLLERYF